MSEKEDELVLEILSPSRKHVREGDIFVIKPKNRDYYFGLVVDIETRIGGFEQVILCYIYLNSSAEKTPLPKLEEKELLIPPFGIDRSPWSRGCFETIDRMSLTDAVTLQQHCFKHPLKDVYYDEHHKEVSPCGQYIGLDVVHSDITIDYAIGKALGMVDD